jgi:hypothetical protein
VQIRQFLSIKNVPILKKLLKNTQKKQTPFPKGGFEDRSRLSGEPL